MNIIFCKNTQNNQNKEEKVKKGQLEVRLLKSKYQNTNLKILFSNRKIQA